MKKLFFMRVLFISIMVIAIVAPEVMGATITINRVSASYGSGPGGEFNLTPSHDLNWLLDNYATDAKVGGGFESFCVEKNEYISLPGIYNATISDRAIDGGVGGRVASGGDPISVGTAWLYNQFRLGVLAGYEYMDMGNRRTSADALQDTIWWLEDEITVKPSNIFTTAVIAQFHNDEAMAKADNGLYVFYPVAVLNLTDSGGPHQDQLVAVPEPATLFLLGSGLIALGILGGRRFKTRS